MSRSWDDPGFSSICVRSLVHVTGSLAGGFTIFTGLLVLWPGPDWDETLPSLFVLNLVWLAVSLAGGIFRLPRLRPSPVRRLGPALLLGSSLAAILWLPLESPLRYFALGSGFLVRWSLHAADLIEIHQLDSRKISLPPPSARIRLAITWITGALIPALVLMGIGPRHLLFTSFLLTAFAQWSATCELLVQERKA